MAQYHVSPIGTFNHPWVNKPDTKFNADGLFTVDLSLKGETAETLAKKIEGASLAAFNEHVAELKPADAKKWSQYNPFERVEDDDGNATGEIVFSFKQNRLIKLRDGSTKTIAIEIRDAADRVIDKAIYSGSEGRILFSMRPIVMTSSKQVGVRLDFAKVQVTKLQQGGGASRGFGKVEGGYEADSADQGFGGSDGTTTDGGGDY